MERLTYRDESGIARYKVEISPRKKMIYSNKAIGRLAEYEDTGLSPEEVAELAKAEGRLYTRHDVAVILAEFMGDNCACNFNGIDELLPKYCELLKSCPDVVGVACWEQYLKHRNKLTAEQSSVVERRDDIDSD